MPFFQRKFSPKKVPPRKRDISVLGKELGAEFASRELGLEIPPVKLTLANCKMTFEDGQWSSESGRSGWVHNENNKLRKMLRGCEEENNLLKLKYELLLDMLTQTTFHSQIQLKQIDSLKRHTPASSSKQN